MKDFEARWAANITERKEVFVLKHFAVIKVEKAQTRRPRKNI